MQDFMGREWVRTTETDGRLAILEAQVARLQPSMEAASQAVGYLTSTREEHEQH